MSGISDPNQAIAMLDAHKHWTIRVLNSGKKRRYQVELWAYGKRVLASGTTVPRAAQLAIDKAHDKAMKGRTLRLVGQEATT